jgi:hypothetical protein
MWLLAQPMFKMMMGKKTSTPSSILSKLFLQITLWVNLTMIFLVNHWFSHYPVGRVITRIPINNKATRDIEIDVDITLQDFVSRVCTNMGLDPATAQIGWKSYDDAKHAHAQQLATEDKLLSTPLKRYVPVPSVTFSSWRTIPEGQRRL